MSFSHSPHSKKAKQNQPLVVVLLDFDGVQQRIEEEKEAPKQNRKKKTNKEDKQRPEEGSLIDQEGHENLIKLCHKFRDRVELFTITSRPEEQRDYIYGILNGKKSEEDIKLQGGVSKDHIICIGQGMKDKRGNTVLLSNRLPKLKRIQELQKSTFPNLPNAQFLFVDDVSDNTTPVKEAGYSVIEAEANTNKHYPAIMEFIQNKVLGSYAGNYTSTLLEPNQTDVRPIQVEIDSLSFN